MFDKRTVLPLSLIYCDIFYLFYRGKPLCAFFVVTSKADTKHCLTHTCSSHNLHAAVYQLPFFYLFFLKCLQNMFSNPKTTLNSNKTKAHYIHNKHNNTTNPNHKQQTNDDQVMSNLLHENAYLSVTYLLKQP